MKFKRWILILFVLSVVTGVVIKKIFHVNSSDVTLSTGSPNSPADGEGSNQRAPASTPGISSSTQPSSASQLLAPLLAPLPASLPASQQPTNVGSALVIDPVIQSKIDSLRAHINNPLKERLSIDITSVESQFTRARVSLDGIRIEQSELVLEKNAQGKATLIQGGIPNVAIETENFPDNSRIDFEARIRDRLAQDGLVADKIEKKDRSWMPSEQSSFIPCENYWVEVTQKEKHLHERWCLDARTGDVASRAPRARTFN